MSTRRTRTVFHYKVEEELRAEDREAYLALILAARTTNESAHAWLLERGYSLSLSAVARHRRRHIAANRTRQAEIQGMELFARCSGNDMAAGIEAYFQHLVFEHLIRLGRSTPSPFDDDADDAANDDSRLNATELLRLSKLVASAVDMAAKRAVSAARTSPSPQQAPRDEAAAEADLVNRIQDILGVRRPTPPPGVNTA